MLLKFLETKDWGSACETVIPTRKHAADDSTNGDVTDKAPDGGDTSEKSKPIDTSVNALAMGTECSAPAVAGHGDGTTDAVIATADGHDATQPEVVDDVQCKEPVVEEVAESQ